MITGILYRVLDDKLKKIDSEGEEFIDLTTKSFEFTYSRVEWNGHTLVKPGEEGRPDLIADAVLGDQNLLDALLKFNGISNPYAVDAGDILLVPTKLSISNCRIVPEESGGLSELNDFRLQFKDINSRDSSSPIKNFNDLFDDRVEEIYKNGSDMPPNLADFGDKQFITKGGKVYYAPAIGKNTAACDEPPSKGEYLARLIKNRMNRI